MPVFHMRLITKPLILLQAYLANPSQLLSALLLQATSNNASLSYGPSDQSTWWGGEPSTQTSTTGCCHATTAGYQPIEPGYPTNRRLPPRAISIPRQRLVELNPTTDSVETSISCNTFNQPHDLTLRCSQRRASASRSQLLSFHCGHQTPVQVRQEGVYAGDCHCVLRRRQDLESRVGGVSSLSIFICAPLSDDCRFLWWMYRPHDPFKPRRCI